MFYPPAPGTVFVKKKLFNYLHAPLNDYANNPAVWVLFQRKEIFLLSIEKDYRISEPSSLLVEVNDLRYIIVGKKNKKKSMFQPDYYTHTELEKAKFKALGHNVSIAKNFARNMSIGDKGHIHGYCSVITVGESFGELGSPIHIGGYWLLIVSDGMVTKDFQAFHKVSKSTDELTIGPASVILSNITIGERSSVGAQARATKPL